MANAMKRMTRITPAAEKNDMIERIVEGETVMRVSDGGAAGPSASPTKVVTVNGRQIKTQSEGASFVEVWSRGTGAEWGQSTGHRSIRPLTDAEKAAFETETPVMVELAKRAAKRNTPKERAAAKSDPTPCWCGCGADARSRFLPGHDAKLKGALARYYAPSSDKDISRPNVPDAVWDNLDTLFKGRFATSEGDKAAREQQHMVGQTGTL